MTCPKSVQFFNRRTRIYAAASLEPKIIVIDGADNSILTSVPVGGLPIGITVDPSTNRIYVTDLVAEEILVIDGVTDTIAASVPIANPQDSIEINPVTRRLYVTDGTGLLSVLDADTLAVIDTITLPIAAAGRIAVNSFTNRIYVSNALGYSTAFVVIDGKTNEIVTTFLMDSVTNGIALNSATNRIYLVNNGLYENTGTLLIVDGNTNQIVETHPVGTDPYDVDVDPTTSRVYVINYTGSSALGSALVAAGRPNTGLSRTGSYEPLASISYDALIVFQDVHPALIAPRRNYFTTPTPTLTWNRVSWATEYEVQVDSAPTFTTPLSFTAVVPSNTLEVTTTVLPDGTYYWRVRAKKPDGTWGGWSAVDSFAVDAP
jgi:DNA-binding beta-propeller fold protein YncE